MEGSIGGSNRALALALLACLVVAASTLVLAGDPARAWGQTVEQAAPYEYLGWGDPQPPTEVLATTGIRDLTLAFVLSHGACDPMWDGSRPLTGGSDAAAIDAIRAAGGEVDVSFGGWSGKKLGSSCKSPEALAAAYQKVIDAYSLRAIDIDIEHGEFTNKATRKRVVAALALVAQHNPGIEISVTFGTGLTGPERDGVSLIDDAAAIGFQPSAWTIMPFDFDAPVSNMGAVSIEALEGLAADLVSAYHYSSASAYEHSGISSMSGDTDETDETVSIADFRAMLAFAAQRHLARMSFWAVNRDRPCGGADSSSEDCGGIAQAPYEFSDALSGFHG